jgi:hypothetical protein
MNCVPSIAPKYELEIKSTTPILIGSVFMILLVLFLIVTDTLNSPLDAYVCLSVSNLLYLVGGVPSPKSYFKYVK